MTQYSRPRTDKVQVILSLPEPEWLTAVQVACLVTEYSNQVSLIPIPERLAFARRLIGGEKIDVYDTEFHCLSYPSPLEVEVIPSLDKWEEFYEKRDRDGELLDKAVAGDAQAAIEFCTKLKSGEINWGVAMG